MARIIRRECLDCKVTHDLMWWPDAKDGIEHLSQDNEDPYDLTCPGCQGSNHRELIPIANAIWQGGDHGVGNIYPYFDRSLGCEVRSHNHRKQLMKERGLVECTEADLEREIMAKHHQTLEAIERTKRTEREYEDNPAFRDYRELRDKGYYADQLRERYPTKTREQIQAALTRNARK